MELIGGRRKADLRKMGGGGKKTTNGIWHDTRKGCGEFRKSKHSYRRLLRGKRRGAGGEAKKILTGEVVQRQSKKYLCIMGFLFCGSEI
jgi:hypothetical protein